MSLSYPNRKDWLRVRATPSAVYRFSPGYKFGRYVYIKGTFNDGRNAEKRKVGKGWAREFRLYVETVDIGLGRETFASRTFVTSAKRKTAARMHLLADRRVRQHQ